MAGIDKLYCYTKKDFLEFYHWCEKCDYLCKRDTQLSLLDYFYTTPEMYDTAYSCYTRGVPIANFRESMDMWILYHCPIRWVREYMLNIQYPSLKLKTKRIMLYYV